MTTAKDLFFDRPFLIYLAQLDEDLLLRMYESKSCVISVFRMLPPMSQKCFQHLLYRPNSDWKKWAKKRFLMTIYQNLVLLFKLRIVEGHLDGKKEVNTDFRMNFISSLLSSPTQLTEFKRLEVFEEKSSKKKKSGEKDLLKKSVECWETVLRYLVSPNDATIKAVSTSTRELFQHVGFMGTNLEISKEGFHFLLLSRVEQIWTYVIYYLRYLDESKETDVFSSVEFFLKLMLSVSSCDNFDTQKDGSKSTPISINSEWQPEVQQFLLHMREIGLVYMRKRKDGYFFLTPLLYVLAASEGTAREPSQTAAASAKNLSSASGNKTTKGFLMVETNFKVFAYTDSTLQMAILSIFTSLLYRFHDVVVGEITRDSVRKALQTGVTAEQIVLYLKANGHPQSIAAQGQANCIPSNVVDQIHLWDEERKRLNCTDGTLYSNFYSEAEFVEMRDFASGNNILQWQNSMQRLLVVTEEGHDMVKEWRKGQRNMY